LHQDLRYEERKKERKKERNKERNKQKERKKERKDPFPRPHNSIFFLMMHQQLKSDHAEPCNYRHITRIQSFPQYFSIRINRTLFHSLFSKEEISAAIFEKKEEELKRFLDQSRLSMQRQYFERL